MQQFYSPRTRLFRKRRARLRNVVVPALAMTSVYAILTFFNSEKPAAVPQTAGVVAPAPAMASAAHAGESLNLKTAFSSAPVPAARDYAAFSHEDLPQKVALPVGPAPKSTLVAGIEQIQSGISGILQSAPEALPAEKTLEIGKGDTLMELLVENKVPRGEAHEAISALSKVYDPRDLSPGHEITVFFHQDPSIADRRFSGLRIEKDMINTVVVNRADDGGYSVEEQEKTVHRAMRGYRGRIDSSLYVSAKAHGVPDGVILDMIKMYSMNVDFQRDIQSGDGFEVMYEEYATEEGKVVPGRGHILYAQMTLGGRTLPFYRYEDRNGDVDYYDEGGKSAKKTLMKTPIDGARLSSGFGMRRHPVLGYSKMHKGSDFAAPRGTPVYAAGDGVIEKLGKFSSYGNYIRIRHRGDLKTAYAHLNGYKSGLKAGSRVKQGQVIGYVGNTGRSTGPHLHYEVMVNGVQVNPNSLKLPTGKALEGRDLDTFRKQVRDSQVRFASLQEGKETATADASVAAAAETTARN